MARVVYVPELGRSFSFKDGTTDREVSSFFQSKFPFAPQAAPQAAVPESVSDESGILGRFAYGLGRGITDIPGGIASLIYPAEEAAKTTAGQISEKSRQYLEETLGIDPTKDPTATQMTAQALGSVASFLIPGTAAMKGVGLLGKGAALAEGVGTATAAAQGVALGAEQRSEKIRQQLASGMVISPEQQIAAQRLDGLIGASEALPLHKFFGPLQTILSKVPVSKAPLVERIIENRLGKITRAGIEEGAQEVASGVANDLVEYGIYNPNVQIGQDILSNAGTGAFAGSFVEGVIQLAAGRKAAPYRQLAKDIQKEKGENAQAVRQGNIAQAAENLRQSNISGPIDVNEEEIDGLQKFTIKAPSGNVVATFDNRADAVEAVQQYALNTAADVKVREPFQAPEIFPVKIGKGEFNSIDEVVAARDDLLDQKNRLVDFSMNDSLMEAESKKKGVDKKFYQSIVLKQVDKYQKDIGEFDAFINRTKGIEETPTPEETSPIAEAPAAAPEEVTPIGATETPIEESFVPAEAVTPVPIETEAQAAELPIGAVEMPVEEQRFIEEAPAVITPEGEAPAGRTEMRPSATPEQLADLQTELFGQPTSVSRMTPEQRVAYEAERDKRFPPEPVTVYYSGSPAPGSTSIPETTPMQDALSPREYTPERLAWNEEVKRRLIERLSPIIGNKARLEARIIIGTKPNYLIRGQASVVKTPDGIESLIELSTGILKPGMTVEAAVEQLAKTMNHEVIHVLRDLGLFHPNEWQVLSRAAAEAKVPGKKYTYLDKAEAVYTEDLSPVYANPEAVLEEAVAEMYKDWVTKREAKQNARGLFNRITEFFRRIFNTIKMSKYETVFKAIEAGKMRDREVVGRSAAKSPRFSAAPLPPIIEQRNRTLFREPPKGSIFQSISDFFLGPAAGAKTLSTQRFGTIDVSGVSRAAVSARTKVVDKNAIVEFLEKLQTQQETGKFELKTADYSATAAISLRNRSSHLNVSHIMMGSLEMNYATPGDIQSATLVARNSPDNMLKVFSTMLEPGPVDSVTGVQKDKREVFRTYATAIRARDFRAAGIPVPAELDNTYINTAIPYIQQVYPEIVDAYNMYQRVNKKMMETARDSGLFSDAELVRLTRKMNYYGFYRELHSEELTPTSSTKTAGKFDFREYTGSAQGNLIDDPMFVIIQNMQYLTDSMAKNLAVTKVFNLAKDMGEARLLRAGEDPDPTRGESTEVMFFRDKGVTKRFAVKDPLLVTALGADDSVDVGMAMKLAGLPTKVIRESVTRDPGFMIANLLRDTVASWITSGEDITPFVGTAKGWVSALKSSTSYEALAGRGAIGSYDMAMMTPEEMAATLKRRLTPANIKMVTSANGIVDLTKLLWDRLGYLSEVSDAATRIAVYEAARKQGMSEAEATFRAIRILDFSRRGSSQLLSILTKVVPFLNARIQGLDVVYQAGASVIRLGAGKSYGEKDVNLGKKVLVRGAMYAALSIALEMYCERDEEYKNIPDYVKIGNLLIPLMGFGLPGQFIAIPKGFEPGLIFSTFPQQLYKTATGQASGRENAGLFFSSLASTFGVNPVPQFLLPAVEVLTNHDFYTGLPLISEGKLRLAPEMQYDSRTSTIAMMFGNLPIKYNFDTGKFEGISPIVIDKLISGYGGPLGTILVSYAGMVVDEADIGPERLPKSFSQMPVIRRVFVDAETKGAKSVSDAYELFRIVDEANRTFSRLRQSGDAEAAVRYLEENKEALKYKKYVFKLVDRLNKMSAYERQIERDPAMSRDEKFEAMKQIREARLALTSQISQINKAMGR